MIKFTLVRRLQGAFSQQGLAPQEIATPVQWVEIVALSLGTVALAWWIRPLDPALTLVSFPWLWLVPVLLALRYGVLPGMLGSLVLVANQMLALKLGRLSGEFPINTLFGGGLLVLLCGEFSDVWRDRNQRMEETYLYVTERLSRVTKRHLLLNLSHDRLEQEMLARPGTLRDALVRLRGLCMQESSKSAVLPGAQGVLQLLSQYVNIESGAMYALVPADDSYALGQQVASLGEPVALTPEDELLTLALQQGSLAHIASQETSLPRQTQQLVVAPLVAGDDQLIGVLAVTRMPFFSLTTENLQMMLVLLGYYADNLGSVAGVVDLQRLLPTMPVLFAQELARVMHLYRRVHITSHLVVLRFESSHGAEMVADFLRIKRGLDLYWQTVDRDTPVLVVLMPFAAAPAKDGFVRRLEDWLVARFQGDFVSLGVRLRSIDLSQPDSLAQLARAVETA